MHSSTLFASLFFLSSVFANAITEDASHKLQKRSRPSITTTCRKTGQFALTFDDGPYDYQQELTGKLGAAGAKATFFVNGDNWTPCIYDQAEALQDTYRKGHLIASHTWSHSDITTLSEADLTSEIKKVEVALKKILGVKPAFFRPPYGAYNDASLNIVRSMGYTPILWSFDSGDSVGDSAAESKALYAKAARSYPKAQIGLNHETYGSTVREVIPYAIKQLQSKGYKLVTVAECLGKQPYAKVYTSTLPKRDASWHC